MQSEEVRPHQHYYAELLQVVNMRGEFKGQFLICHCTSLNKKNSEISKLKYI